MPNELCALARWSGLLGTSRVWFSSWCVQILDASGLVKARGVWWRRLELATLQQRQWLRALSIRFWLKSVLLAGVSPCGSSQLTETILAIVIVPACDGLGLYCSRFVMGASPLRKRCFGSGWFCPCLL